MDPLRYLVRGSLHWALRIEDVSERVERLSELILEFRNDVDREFARIIENQYKIPVVTGLFTLESALKDASGSDGTRVTERADEVVASIRTWLTCEPAMSVEQSTALHALWARVLTVAAPWISNRGHRADAARASIQSLVARMHRHAVPWRIVQSRHTVVQLVAANRAMQALARQGELLLENWGWDDGLPFFDEPVLAEESADLRKLVRRKTAIQFLGADEETVETIPVDVLEQLANADWNNYALRVSREFGVTVSAEVVRTQKDGGFLAQVLVAQGDEPDPRAGQELRFCVEAEG